MKQRIFCNACIFYIVFFFGCLSKKQYNINPPSYYTPISYPIPESSRLKRECPNIDAGFGNGQTSVNSGKPYRHSASKNLHNGIDFVGNIGDPVYAPAGGTVIVNSYHMVGGGGNILVVYSGMDMANNHIFYLLAHLETSVVSVGDTVHIGQTIGLLGNSGWQLTPHLHFSAFTTKDGSFNTNIFGRLYLANHDLLDPFQMRMRSTNNFIPYDSLYSSLNQENVFLGFTHPRCSIVESYLDQ